MVSKRTLGPQTFIQQPSEIRAKIVPIFDWRGFVIFVTAEGVVMAIRERNGEPRIFSGYDSAYDYASRTVADFQERQVCNYVDLAAQNAVARLETSAT